MSASTARLESAGTLATALSRVFDEESDRWSRWQSPEYEHTREIVPQSGHPLRPEQWEVIYAGPAEYFDPWGQRVLDEPEPRPASELAEFPLYLEVRYGTMARALYGVRRDGSVALFMD